MQNENLFFNVLTFDFPTENQVFYFTKEANEKCQKIHKSLFPKEIDSLYPGISNNGTDFLYTTFTGERAGFKPVAIDLAASSNHDLLKRYYNRQVNYYFRKIKKQIVKVGFIKENQVWVHAKKESNSQWDVYLKFSLKVQVATVSSYPELLVSFDGKSKVLKKSVADLSSQVSTSKVKWVLHGKHLDKWGNLNHEDIDYSEYYPVLNRDIQQALEIPPSIPDRDNRYPKYLSYIKIFYKWFLKGPAFKEFVPINCDGFIPVATSSINTISADSNQLVFKGNKTNIAPKFGMRDLKPFKKSPFESVHLFFIVHKDDTEVAKTLKKYFEKGESWFKGLLQYAHVLFHTEDKFSIVFSDKDNPVKEIERKLSERDFDPTVKYIAIYVSPYTKYEADKSKREIYYKLKEVLLKRDITSQVIDPVKMEEQGDGWLFSLPNIAVAILAKLGGIPWRLNTPVKNELIVGIGAFKHVEEDIQYIGSAFSFSNDGKFNSFEYFMKDEIALLAGKISNVVREYATVRHKPERLIIHFYKSMSERELQHIETALATMDLSIPVFIVSINKTESEDIVAFDPDWAELMPKSGTYMNIGNNKYLLYNNTRYSNADISKFDGYPFPIKLKIDCTEQEQLHDVIVIRELIDQVYQFSRMYWKSIRQQNLPVTIKYPEMVAQIAPHFEGSDIPSYGKNSLWFL